MGRNLPKPSDARLKNNTFMVFDDFEWLVSPHRWTTLAADTGASAAVGNGDNGVLVLTTGATDNNEATAYTTNKPFTVAANKTLVGEGYLQYAEAVTNAANVAFGFASAFGANLLVDNGAGPATNFSGFLIFKVDGGTAWKVVSSNGTTQTVTTSTATAGGSAYSKLRIEVAPVTSTLAEVTFYVDDQILYDAAITNRNQPIKHQYTYTSAAAMNFGAYVKAGSGTSEVLNVDWLAWEKVR